LASVGAHMQLACVSTNAPAEVVTEWIVQGHLGGNEYRLVPNPANPAMPSSGPTEVDLDLTLPWTTGSTQCISWVLCGYAESQPAGGGGSSSRLHQEAAASWDQEQVYTAMIEVRAACLGASPHHEGAANQDDGGDAKVQLYTVWNDGVVYEGGGIVVEVEGESRLAWTHTDLNLDDDMIGKLIRVYYDHRKKWYHGRISSYDDDLGEHMINFDDGDTLSLDLLHGVCEDLPAWEVAPFTGRERFY